MRKYRVPLLETERLYLRKWSKKDAADVFEYAKAGNRIPARPSPK